MIELKDALTNRKLSLKDYLFAVANDMEWTVHSNYGSDNENEIVESLEDVDDEEEDDFDDEPYLDDFDFDSLAIASSTKISHN